MRETLRKLTVFLLAVVALFLLGPGLSRVTAQVVKGSISGTAVDPSGAVVPGATVKATSPETGEERTAVTDQTGVFRLQLLSIGTYNLTISKSGFHTLSMTGIGVQSSQDTSLGSLTLTLGTATTTVEVTAAPPLLEATQSQVTNTIGSNTIQSFPSINLNNGLDILALQMPGVIDDRDSNFSNTNGMGFAVNGIRGRNNDQQIDGQNNNDNSVAGPYLFVANPDFVQEYQVVTNNFGPEYGRNSGSVVNIITKSGTNNWHGDAFITESNWRLDSLSNTQKAFEGLTQVPTFNNEYSGASIGGPLKKDKLFVFGGFDDNIIPGSTVYASGSLTPTPAGLSQLQSCFPDSSSVAALANYGPYGITGGNPVPSGTPTTKTLTAADGGNCSVQFAGVQRTLATPFHQYDYTARLDWNGVKDRVYGRWLYQKATPLNLDPGSAAAGYPYNVPSFGEDFGFSWTRTLSSAMVNEFRLSYGRLTVEFGGNAIGNTIPNQGNLAEGLTNVNLPSGYLDFGSPTSLPQGRIVNTYQLQDNWSYLHGLHTIKAGTNLTYQRSPNVFLPNYNGQFSFSDFQSFVDNVPSTISITLGSPNLDFREHDSFFYVGDDYRAKPNLTLNLGLTYTYFGQPADLFNHLDTQNETGSSPFFDPSLPLSVRVFPSLPAPKNQWGPSAGFAYTPQWGGKLTGKGRTVLRGGYRLSYDPPFNNIYTNIASSAPQVLAQTLSGATANNLPLLAAPFGPAVRSQLASFLTLGAADPRSFNQTSVVPNFRADHVQQWTFGIEREIAPNAVVEARYVGNHGGNLFQSINGNPYIADIAAVYPNALPAGVTPCPASQAVVSSAVGRVNCSEGVERLRTNTGVSDYEGLQTEFRATNLAHQLTLRTAYTWSKTTDNTSDIFNTGGGGNTLAFSQNPLDYVGGEHGLSGLDIPQNWTLSFVEQIPWHGNQEGLIGHLLGGWSVAGTYLIASGQPYTPVQAAINTFTGPNEFFDTPFNAGFIGFADETARPFAGSPTAPVSAVGIYAGDACQYLGVGCSAAATQLISFNAANASGSVVNMTPSQVRFIANGQTADSVYGTPFGNVGRNTARDYHTNTANFSVAKDTRVTERVKLQFRMDMTNIFNHPNFSSVDPFLDDAGLTEETTGFGVPSLFTGGNRTITFALKAFF
ncbi:MAG TPA: carboxypeptidase regulatory-like domain-containing protein [Terriglobia bacterium]|nr:carboxypeptidase regulatory-like domain-containing protein [Terriglobia bacterium]